MEQDTPKTQECPERKGDDEYQHKPLPTIDDDRPLSLDNEPALLGGSGIEARRLPVQHGNKRLRNPIRAIPTTRPVGDVYHLR